ncbi:MAG: M42 family metallopeptidase [Anaerolineae bacterium]|nr:M42 family metallopeptidase [Anaerolineae bacterium]
MLLKELSEAVGVSGKEEAVRKVILSAIEGHVSDIRIDPLGSITAIKKGTQEGYPRVMLDAHMDEVGFMVMGFDSDGLIRFTNIGGIDDRILPGMRVKVGDKLLPGVIVWTPIHKNRDQNVVKMSNLRIDVGCSSKDEVSKVVNRGDRVAFDSAYRELSETFLSGKAFDDRVGCSLLVDVLQGGPYSVDVLAAFTVQEEIGTRGAAVAVKRLQPDVAFALEGAPTHDLPNPMAEPDDPDEPNPVARLGAGPVITVMDRSMITDPRLLRLLHETARANNIPFQHKTALGGGTDAGRIHMSNAGVPSAVISVPCRYIHSPAAVLNRDDYANALRLIQAVLNNFTPDILQRNS